MDVATQQEVLTAIRSVSGLITFGYAFKTFFISKWQTGKSKVHRKSVFRFFKVKIQSVAGTTM